MSARQNICRATRERGMFQTLRNTESLEYIPFCKWEGKSNLFLSIISPQALPKFDYSNETELGPKRNQRHLVHLKSQF